MRVRAWAFMAIAVAAGCNSLTGASDVGFAEPEEAPEADASTGTTGLPRERDAGGAAPLDARAVVDAGGADAEADAPRGPLRVFVTSETWTGNLGGLAGADLKCKLAAAAANLGGTGVWVAWASTNADNVRALDRLASDGPWHLVDGTVLAATKADVVDGVMSPTLRRTELNEPIDDVNDRTWTGTRADGTPAPYDCARWMSANGNSAGTVGEANQSNGSWSNLGPESCNNQNRLYCFEL
jgi:hypothetical protein